MPETPREPVDAPTVLVTERLMLRALTPADAEALHAVLGDPVAMSAYEHGFSLDETRDWIARNLARYRDDGFGLWAMVLRDTGELIGDAGLTMQPLDDDRVVEVGYHLRRDLWGQGLASVAARACVGWGFAHTGAEAIWARVRETNLQSMNVAIRCGMTVRRRFTMSYRGMSMPHLAFAVARPSTPPAAVSLATAPTLTAPDGSLVHVLTGTPGASTAQFTLAPGLVSIPQRHRTVTESWFVIAGTGRLWVEPPSDPARVVELAPGVSATIPVGSAFQFASDDGSELRILGVTSPPWPGEGEAAAVEGPWQPRLA